MFYKIKNEVKFESCVYTKGTLSLFLYMYDFLLSVLKEEHLTDKVLSKQLDAFKSCLSEKPEFAVYLYNDLVMNMTLALGGSVPYRQISHLVQRFLHYSLDVKVSRLTELTNNLSEELDYVEDVCYHLAINKIMSARSDNQSVRKMGIPIKEFHTKLPKKNGYVTRQDFDSTVLMWVLTNGDKFCFEEQAVGTL